MEESKIASVVSVELSGVSRRKDATSELEPGSTLISGGAPQSAAYSQVVDIPSEEIRRGIESVCNILVSALEKVTPESYSVEFNLGFKAGVKVPVLVSSEASAALKITLNWKSQNSKGEQSASVT